MQKHKYFYERNLPHLQPEEATFFITYRLHGSIPLTKIAELKNDFKNLRTIKNNLNNLEKRKLHAAYFKKFDGLLDNALNEPYWLRQDKIASIVSDSLFFNDAKAYDLICFSIMPNHVHLTLSTFQDSPPLYEILQKHKRFTALQCNKILKRTGSFWHAESYDHLVRDDDELKRVIKYSLNNPVKAKFVRHWTDWKWNYLKKELLHGYSF
jgi:putative transposase